MFERYPLTYRLFLFLSTLSLSTLSHAEPALRLATTTSTDNSGLLRTLLPPFEKSAGITVHVIAVGTGKALRMGQDGDVDVVLVHAKAAEEAFVANGHGVNRRDVMYNDFVILGPPSDPAGIRGLQDAGRALSLIAQARATFVSRGDDSGTHKKERELWASSETEPASGSYLEAGQGMGKVLQMAGELDAYTLSDRGTWIAFRDRLPLDLLVAGDLRLYNPYGVIAVNPAKYSDIRYREAMALIAWMTSVEGQRLIRDFRVQGEALFKPLAITGE